MMAWEAREVWIEAGTPGVPESGPIDLTGLGFGPSKALLIAMQLLAS